MKARCEKYWPILMTIISAIFVFLGCKTCISDTAFGHFIGDFCDNMLSKDSISIFITIEGILFAGLLTFLGLFLQLENKTMDFIKEYTETYCRLLCFIKIPIAITLLDLVFSIFIYGVNISIHWCIYLVWGSSILYSILTSIRMIYVYFVVLTPQSKSPIK